MKRNSLTTALLAGLAGAAGIAATANAVNVNPDGIGGALIYPYYTVNKGNTTLLSIVNTTSQVKAVKVRFLEGRNSREVLDFNLYLSPFDVWVGAIAPSDAANANSGGRLTTPDRSCTVPAIGSGLDFLTFAYDGSTGPVNLPRDHNQTQLPRYSTAERTREGYAEMIEMGVVVAGSPEAAAATHNSAGIPANCGRLISNWLGGVWANTGGAQNISLPTGGLYGSGAIVNGGEGIMYSYDAVALEGFYTNAAAPATLHTDPTRVFPNLGSADSGGGVSRSLVVANNGTTLVQDTWSPVALSGANGGWDSTSAVLMHDAVFNEYVTAAALGSTSEWVVTFPTKNWYVDFAIRSTARSPFARTFFGTTSAPGACEDFTINIWDREEQVPIQQGQILPSPPGPNPGIPQLCYEAQVVSFNQTLTAISPGFSSESANLGSRYALNIPATSGAGGNPPNTPFGAGHARLGFGAASQRLTNPASGNRYQGLPVVGFWALKAINGNVGGALANYSGTWEHKYSRSVTSVTPQ